MRQITQNYKSGALKINNSPAPLCGSGKVLVRNRASLISSGTERSILELGKKNMLGKAKARPELFRRFIQRARSEGFIKVWNEALMRLDESKPLGYSSSGEVIEAGQGVNEFKQGDRVACIGANYATHSEIISLPECLCVKVPEGVSFEEAAFGMLGIIALQGINRAEVRPGERVAVLGLGLIGQITVQLLKRFGCGVLGIDIDERKLRLATSLGCGQAVLLEDAARAALNFSEGKGMDKIIITAASKDDLPIRLSSEIAAFRAIIVLVGVVDIHIPRQIFWEKELDFRVSKAGGYNPLEKEFDYPQDYKIVSQRENLKLFLELIKANSVKLAPLITHRFPFPEAFKAYDMITAKKPKEAYIGVILKYDEEADVKTALRIISSKPDEKAVNRIGVIGAGLYGRSVILPILKSNKGLRLIGVSTANSNTARQTADSFHFEYCTTDYGNILKDKSIASVFILTRHNLHAKIIKEALEAEKNVFVEKPLATNMNELKALYPAMNGKNNRLMVGFNRRFSPLALEVKKRILSGHLPLLINIQVNAGNVSKGHWVFDEEEGGGRIISEACHFIDLAQFFTGAFPESVITQNITARNVGVNHYDNTASVIRFSDGSICNIFYTSIGNRSYPREKITVFENGAVYEICDFRNLLIHSPRESRLIRMPNQNLGHKEEIGFFFDEVTNKVNDLNELKKGYLLTTLATFKMMESINTGKVCEFNTNDLV